MRQRGSGQAIAGITSLVMMCVLAQPSFSQVSAPSPGTPLQTFKYGVTGTAAGDLDIYVGQQLGFFVKHGLNVQTVTVSSGSATDLLNLVGAGAVQMVDALPDPVVAAGAHTGAFKILNQIHALPERMVARTGITSMDQLKTLDSVKVAVSSPTTSIAALSQFMLEQNGIPGSKIQFIVLGGSAERLAALKTSVVDVGLLTQPSDFIAVAAGLSVLADSTQPQYAPYYGTTDISSTAIIDKDCDLLRKYYAAIREIAAFTKDPANEEKIIDIIATATKTTKVIAQNTVDLYKADNIFPGINDPTATAIGTAKLTAALGTKVAADPSTLVDTSCTH